MSQATLDRPTSDRQTIEIASLGWERIQLVIRARLAPGATLSPDRLRLERPDDPGLRVRPARALLEADRLYLRINVMQGPGQRPMEPGRWVLVLTDPASPSKPSVPLVVANAALVSAHPHGRDFPLRRGIYRVVPAIDARQAFGVEIAVLPPEGAARGRFAAIAGLARSARGRRRLTLMRRGAFGWLYRFYAAAVRHNGRRILFTSDSHEALAGNLKVVHDRMVERGLDRRHELLTLFKQSVAVPRSWRDRLRMPALFARADVIVLDDYQPAIYQLDPGPGVRIIQLWHASGAFKTVGYSRVGKPGGPSPYSRTHKNYTHAIVSSEFDVPFYAEAFGIPEERVVPTGIPRMDRFFDESARAAGQARAHAAFPETEGRTAILFAPTFRGNGPRDAFYDYDRLDFEALHRVAVEKDAVVIVRMHPFVHEPLPIPDRLTDRILDGSRAEVDVNDLLFAVDLLITDYSSIVFEYSTLDRPMLFFAYDLEEYVATRDFYVPLEEFVPGRIVRTFDQLLDAIRRDDYQAEKVAAFAQRHFDHLDGTSTDRVIDELILGR